MEDGGGERCCTDKRFSIEASAKYHVTRNPGGDVWQNRVMSVGVSVWFASHWSWCPIRRGWAPPVAQPSESPHVPNSRLVANLTLGIAPAILTQPNLI